MRYRPFVCTGMAVSALSLSLDGAQKQSPGEWRDLVHAAFEAGINTFEVVQPSQSLLDGLADSLAGAPRNLVMVGLRAASEERAARLPETVSWVIAEARLGYLDLLSVDVAPVGGTAPITAAHEVKALGLASRLVAAGPAEELEAHIAMGGFDAIATPFNILSGWRERHIVRTAMERQMPVIAYDVCPQGAREAAKDAAKDAAKPKTGFFARPEPLAGFGSYAFLRRTPNWTAEQLCLGYALTEPAVATAQMSVKDPAHLAELAVAVERDLPAGAGAQIEMARFSIEHVAEPARKVANA